MFGQDQGISLIHSYMVFLIYTHQQIVRSLQQHVVDEIMYTIQHAYEDSPEDINLPAPELVTVLVSSIIDYLFSFFLG